VPITDDPALPALTFRTWFLGLLSCALLAFSNQFFGYRQNPLYISSLSVQIVVLPLGKFMAACLPSKTVRIMGWSFSLNPGPFNLKEHVLITIFANSGAGTVYAIHVITAVRVFYGKNITFFVSLLVVLTTQVLRHGHARPASRVAARAKRLAFVSFVLRAVRGFSFTVCHVLCARRCWGSVGREYSGGI